MKISSNTVYEHDEHGEVLVLDVHHVFKDCDLDTERGTLVSRVVRYSVEWDGYGPMPNSLRMAETERFREQVGKQLRTPDFISTDEWVEDP